MIFLSKITEEKSEWKDLPLETLIGELYESKRKTALHFDQVSEYVWEKIGLEGNYDLILFEAFMIEIVIHDANENASPSNRKITPEEAIAKRRDMLLLTLGLLKGYYYKDESKTPTKYVSLGDRRKNYVRSSDFVEFISNGEKCGKDLSDKEEKKYIGKLYQYSTDCKEYIPKYIEQCSKGTLQELIEVSKNNHIKGGEIQLPEPIYTLANFPRQSNRNIEPVKDNPQEDPQPTIKDDKSLSVAETMSPDEIAESFDEASQAKEILEEKSIADYINAILESNSYDDVGVELYQKLCHTEEQPPYSEWVATWLLKCIRERFGKTVEADVLLAVFALLPGYQLKDTNIKSRLEKYISESEYVSKISNKKYKTMEAIETLQEKDEIRESLRQLEIKSVTKLAEHIENILDPCNHIKDLGKYGKLDETRNVYCPQKQQLRLASTKISFFRLFLKKHIIKIAAAESIMIVAMLIYILYNWQQAPQSSDEPQRTEEIAENERPKVESITVKPDFIPLQTGETYPLSVSVRPVGAYADLAYKSENEQIATVSSNGEITAQGNWRENEYIGTNITVWAKNIIEEEICDKTFVLIEKQGNEDESHEYISQKSIPEQ